MSRKTSPTRARRQRQDKGLRYLEKLADQAMLERGLDPTYSSQARKQAAGATGPAQDPSVVDLRALAWCSIDNGEGELVSSRDLDQLTVASVDDGVVTVRVAISDVDALVELGSPIDRQACRNTTSVYCPGKTYPMLPPRFSEDLTSLAPGQDRLALVTEMTFAPGGEIATSTLYRALVRNHAALNYEAAGAWLEARREPPLALAGHPELAQSLRLQDQVAQRYKEYRRRRGSLALESLEARAVVEGGAVLDMVGQLRNRATELIENLMVACNGCTSRYLKREGFPTFQRIVRRPKHWSRIVELAGERGYELPREPESGALQLFLQQQRSANPLNFPDLCLQVLKLLGRGEYVVEIPGQPLIGHFGLAVREYSHSTAPNRRYPDLIAQRLLKAALAAGPCPYSRVELEELARHCTEQEANAQKVERRMAKCAAASMLAHRLGETFDAVASGQNDRATWVRLLGMPVEGMLLGHARLGSKLRVRLERVDVENGFIDFVPQRR